MYFIFHTETPYFVKQPTDKLRVVGDAVQMCCNADGNPLPTITW